MRLKKRIVIGVTGGIGSGKTSACSLFAKLGAKVINADTIVKDVYNKHPGIVKQIAKTFGKDVLNANGRLNINVLSEKAFANKTNAGKLNTIVHPLTLKVLKAKIRRENGLVVVDAPLLIESSFHRNVNYVVLLKSRRDLQIKRALKNNRLSEEDVRQRLNCQLPFKDKKRFANFIIDNRGSISKLKKQVKRIYKEVK